jgi:hypothetical protein
MPLEAAKTMPKMSRGLGNLFKQTLLSSTGKSKARVRSRKRSAKKP